MRKLWLPGVALLLGLLLGNSSSTRWLFSNAEAAPADVFGSPNIAVDTYRNVRGTFILWSDGKITNVDNGTTDLGRPYSAPPPSARISAPRLENGRPTGSPNVAVKAIPRPDFSFVLFADGTIKKPANADAAAGTSGGTRVISGVVGADPSNPNPRYPSSTSEYTATAGYSGTTGGTAVQVRLTTPVGANSTAMGFLLAATTGAGVGSGGISPNDIPVPVIGTISSDGSSVSFPVSMSAGSASYNVLYFSIADHS